MSAAHRPALAAVRTAIAAATAVVTAACGAGTATIAGSRIRQCVPRIVYMREGSGPPQMLTMLPNGRQVRRLGIGHAPKWSPDGRQIAFDNGAHILVMRATGARARDITPRLRGRNSIDPAWSPDGRWIAFSSEPAGTSNAALWLVRSDGLDPHMLVNAPGEEEHPSWSPDGTQIVFDSPRQQSPDNLYLVRADGSGLRRITGDALDAWGPDWAATNEILFASGSGKATDNIFTIRPDGSGLRQITRAPSGVAFGLPNRSSNGDSIAFTRATTTSSQLYSMTSAGTGLRVLTRGQPGLNGWPDWGTCTT